MRNIQVVEAFINGETKAKAGNLYIAGKKLINYNTVIGQVVDGAVLFNATKYSRSTTTIQNMLKREIESHGYEVKTVLNVPRGESDLSKYSN